MDKELNINFAEYSAIIRAQGSDGGVPSHTTVRLPPVSVSDTGVPIGHKLQEQRVQNPVNQRQQQEQQQQM